jgi:hypothetical protein
MTTAGTTVGGGYYLNRDAWDLIAVNGKEGVLPGQVGERYVRVPLWAVLALAPMAGGLFVVFLPLVGFALVYLHFGRALVSRVKGLLGRRQRPPADSDDGAASEGRDA